MTPKNSTAAGSRPRPKAVMLLVVVLAVAIVVLRLAPGASAHGHGCPTTDPNCVGISTSQGGSPGIPGRPGHSGGGGGSSSAEWDPCATLSGYIQVLCEHGMSTSIWDRCYEGIYKTYSGTLSLADLNTLLAANNCPTMPVAAPVLPTPAELALRAASTFELPDPAPGRYPAGKLPDGRPYTVVKAYTWYWTSAATWKSDSATARAGANWATVTATPVKLSFSPGDGSGGTSCAGPGEAWSSSYGPWAAAPSGCDYRYQHSSINQPGGMITATYTTTWQLTWVGSGGTGGTLPGRETTSQSTFAVAELQSVVTH